MVRGHAAPSSGQADARARPLLKLFDQLGVLVQHVVLLKRLGQFERQRALVKDDHRAALAASRGDARRLGPPCVLPDLLVGQQGRSRSGFQSRRLRRLGRPDHLVVAELRR